MNRTANYCAIAAALCCSSAVLGFGAALDGYSQAHHPLGLLGGRAIPNALAFNLAGFVVPGMLAVIAISSLRTSLALAAGWSMRIGVQLLVLSAMAFALLGLVPLDPADLDAAASRYHALTWTLWWIAFVPGAVLLAWSLRRHRQFRPQVWVALLAALVVLAHALFAPGSLPAGIPERISFAAWFGWLVFVTRARSLA